MNRGSAAPPNTNRAAAHRFGSAKCIDSRSKTGLEWQRDYIKNRRQANGQNPQGRTLPLFHRQRCQENARDRDNAHHVTGENREECAVAGNAKTAARR